MGEQTSGGRLSRGSNRLLRELALLLAVTGGLAALAFGGARLLFRDTATPNVSLELEKSLRPVMRRQIAAEGVVVEARVATMAVTGLLERLKPAFGSLPLEPEVLIVDSATVNAVALPGGIVCVYSGLVRVLDSPEELAAVLAHELAHVESRDSMTLLARQIGVAVLVAAVSGGNESVAQSILRSAINIGYTRAAEDRADARCLEILEAAGIDPAALAEALSAMTKVKRKTPKLLKYLDTHSDVVARIQGARERSRAWTGTRRPLDVDWEAARKALPPALEAAP